MLRWLNLPEFFILQTHPDIPSDFKSFGDVAFLVFKVSNSDGQLPSFGNIWQSLCIFWQYSGNTWQYISAVFHLWEYPTQDSWDVQNCLQSFGEFKLRFKHVKSLWVLSQNPMVVVTERIKIILKLISTKKKKKL